MISNNFTQQSIIELKANRFQNEFNAKLTMFNIKTHNLIKVGKRFITRQEECPQISRPFYRSQRKRGGYKYVLPRSLRCNLLTDTPAELFMRIIP